LGEKDFYASFEVELKNTGFMSRVSKLESWEALFFEKGKMIESWTLSQHKFFSVTGENRTVCQVVCENRFITAVHLAELGAVSW